MHHNLVIWEVTFNLGLSSIVPRTVASRDQSPVNNRLPYVCVTEACGLFRRLAAIFMVSFLFLRVLAIYFHVYDLETTENDVRSKEKT